LHVLVEAQQQLVDVCQDLVQAVAFHFQQDQNARPKWMVEFRQYCQGGQGLGVATTTPRCDQFRQSLQAQTLEAQPNIARFHSVQQHAAL